MERARPAAEKLDAYAKTLEPIVKAEQLALERDSALATEQSAHHGRVSVIDERVAGLEKELAAAKAAEREIEAELAEAEAAAQRAEVKAKRAEIELRNATALAEGAAGPRSAASKQLGPAS